jgi:hypothetical protein
MFTTTSNMIEGGGVLFQVMDDLGEIVWEGVDVGQERANQVLGLFNELIDEPLTVSVHEISNNLIANEIEEEVYIAWKLFKASQGHHGYGEHHEYEIQKHFEAGYLMALDQKAGK